MLRAGALAASLAAALLCAVAPLSADAKRERVGAATYGVITPGGVAAASEFPEHHRSSKGGGPLEYHGGPVMTSNTNYVVYWQPAGSPAFPAGYQATINKWFADLAHESGSSTNTDSVLVQYTDSSGEHANYQSTFAGGLVDTEPYPASGCSAATICLTDAQIRNALGKFIKANSLPRNLTHEYFVVTPPGVESCFSAASKECSAGTTHSAYCSYHSFFHEESGVVVYADTPYVAGLGCDPGEQHPNGNEGDAAIAGGLAHEHSESVTDPELNAWYTGKEEEVADKCRTFREASEFGEPLGLAPDGAKYNQLINGDLFYYPQEWSNAAGACEQRAAVRPAIKKLTPKSGPAAGGTAVTVTGSGFAAGATVKFGETEGTHVEVTSATTLTVLSPAHAKGAVYLTVATADGTSAVVKSGKFKFKQRRPRLSGGSPG